MICRQDVKIAITNNMNILRKDEFNKGESKFYKHREYRGGLETRTNSSMVKKSKHVLNLKSKAKSKALDKMKGKGSQKQLDAYNAKKEAAERADQ